ncbi:ABC transporter permease [uncultured Mucilaginibacter sp.]|uniref:ABC transporter permease n=1 Tax=uncultured Mucilaginibacter sp. TaxID=797541 RepID=UPI00263575F3|nr:ABC transporter permease [uncultured Mucilaginibacter sp.]
MFKNYIKIAFRNFWRNKSFSAINILGLSIGISVCFIIMLFVQDELSYDRFNTQADRIVRVVFKANINGGKIFEATVMPPVAQTMKNDYPEVEEATRLREVGKPKVTYANKTFKEESMALADANFFKVFTLPLIKGDVKTALQQTNTVVITQETANRYFGKEDPIGKILTLNNKDLYKVTGVIAAIPTNSHFHFDLFGSMQSLPEAKEPTWMASNFFTYLLLKDGYDYKKLEAKLPGMVEKYMGPQIAQSMGMSLSQFRTKGNELGFALQPLTDIHLHSQSNYELEPGGDIKYVYIFGAIAIFVLLTACINFINLSTASASKRAKEVGIRKVIGSGKPELVKQFLLESVLLAFMALIVSILCVQLVLPAFNELSGKSLSLGFALKPWAAFIALGLLVGILAGIYPAFFLSSFKPIAIIKGKLGGSTKSFGLRSGLVVFQFFISVSLIVSTLVVYQQMQFIRNKKLGYNKEQLLVLPNSWALGKNERVFKEEMLKDPRILNATVSGYKPAGPTNGNNSLIYPNGKENSMMRTNRFDVDEQYIPTFGMQITAGRNFSKSFPTDSSAVIINEAAANAFGFKDNSIGQNITWIKGDKVQKVSYRVIGVVKDFHFKSLHEAITPLFMVLNPEPGLIFKIKTGDVPGLLSTMKQQWEKFNVDEPFTYSFINELYNKTYSAEEKTGRILNIFTMLTILVACLGLFGLAIYTTEQRTKEIGIRKVLGASVASVTTLLSKDFIKLVLVACVIAFPASYFAMQQWLQDFAYRIEIRWWIFALAGLLAVLIALFTISFQAVKAALANPVKSLRSE